MWQPDVDKLQRKNLNERLKKLEDEVKAQKASIVELQKRIEELEKKK